jgi:hypothetical protein
MDGNDGNVSITRENYLVTSRWRQQRYFSVAVEAAGVAARRRGQQRGSSMAAAEEVSACRRRPAWRWRQKLGVSATSAVAAQSTIN